jgi:hypothetical protein
MTYASEMYAWYAGSVEADVYFCPERQGTYFGSFFLTATAGQDFLAALSAAQAAEVTGLVALQRNALNDIVVRRQEVSTLLRRFQTGAVPDSATVVALSARYGELDGQIAYWYTTRFVSVARSLTSTQRAVLTALAAKLGYLDPAGAFLYSALIPMPAIPSTDAFFR